MDRVGGYPHRQRLLRRGYPNHGARRVEEEGGKGAYLSFSDQMVADGYVCEIAPGGALKPQRHLYEEIILIAEG